MASMGRLEKIMYAAEFFRQVAEFLYSSSEKFDQELATLDLW
jgi:hypothetical protein